MSSLALNLSGFLLFFALINAASSLRCYSCTSLSPGGCNSSDTNQIRECSWNNFSRNLPPFLKDLPPVLTDSKYKCIQMTQTFGDRHVVFKDCINSDICSGGSTSYESCSTCETDLCNSSVNVKAGVLTLIFGILMSFIISK